MVGRRCLDPRWRRPCALAGTAAAAAAGQSRPPDPASQKPPGTSRHLLRCRVGMAGAAAPAPGLLLRPAACSSRTCPRALPLALHCCSSCGLSCWLEPLMGRLQWQAPRELHLMTLLLLLLLLLVTRRPKPPAAPVPAPRPLLHWAAAARHFQSAPAGVGRGRRLGLGGSARGLAPWASRPAAVQLCRPAALRLCGCRLPAGPAGERRTAEALPPATYRVVDDRDV
jgi:hypothetical protein